MSDGKVKLDFSGKLSLDTDPSKVKPNDITSARNIQFLTDGTESTNSYIPMKGNNTPAFDLGSVPVQNKTWRLFISQQIAVHNGHLYFINQFGQVINNDTFPYNISVPNFYVWDMSQNFSTQVAAIIAIISTGFWQIDSTATFSNTDTSGNNTAGYIDITLNLFTGYDWNLIATNSGSAIPSFTDPKLVSYPIREAYDITASGALYDTEGHDLIGDLYIWSTPQRNLPLSVTLSVTNVTSVVGGSRPASGIYLNFAVTFSSPHNLITGSKISLAGSGTAIDGTWIINVLSATQIQLVEYWGNYVVVASPFNIIVSSYLEGVGEIGVATLDIPTDVWTYTRLLRTKEWNFRTKYQIDGRPSTRTADRDSFYFTDAYNPQRAFYYTKPFVTDGALAINGGRYTYGSIASETRNIIASSGAEISFVSQQQSGGQVASGNWRYSGQFLTDSLAVSLPLIPTNPISVYSAATNSNPQLIIGDDPSVVTPKINNLLVTGINPGQFKYFELIGINYVGDAIQGFIIKRILLDGISDTLNVQHIGSESGQSQYDTGLLLQTDLSIATVKSNEIIDNRLVNSNITLTQQQNFTTWAQTIKHSVYYTGNQPADSVQTVRIEVDNSGVQPGSLRMGEYQDPNNVNNKMGYMLNDTYRVGIRGYYKDTGVWSDAFFVDDITFDTLTYARRNNTLPNLDLVQGGLNFINVPYFALENIDLDYIVNGKRIREWFSKLEAVRCECIPEVLADGIMLMGIKGYYTWAGAPLNTSLGSENPPNGTPIGTLITDAFLGGNPYTSSGVARLIEPNYGSFYSPDIFFNKVSIAFNGGDKLLNFGQPVIWNTFPYAQLSGITAESYYDITYAQTGSTSAGGAHPFQSVALTDTINIVTGTQGTLSGGAIYEKRKYLLDPNGSGSVSNSDSPSSPVVYYSGGFTRPDTNGGTDYGLRRVQYFRQLTNKYGDITTNSYVSIGSIIDIDVNTISPLSITCFGGDTFTQKSYYLVRIYDSQYYGASEGISFYSQNRVNAQMKIIDGTASHLYPGITPTEWLTAGSYASEGYNTGYTIKNEVESIVGFNPSVIPTTSLPNWILWSDINLGSGGTDGYRNFLPANFHVLNGTYGAILHHANANGELITWQERAFMRQYFNTRGTLSVQNITQILIGDGSVMSRDGVTMSRFGSLNKWGVIHGVTPNGDDVYMWINTETKNVCHYGQNGTLTISDDNKSFFANNLTWVQGKDTPADDEGIHGVYDQRYNNFIFTIKGKLTPSNLIGNLRPWDSSLSYSVGALTFFSPDPFNVIGDVYQTLIQNSNNRPDLFPLEWKKLPDDGTYYNQYTIVYSGYKVGFLCFAAFLPRIYNKWANTFFSPSPIPTVSEIFRYNTGALLTWFTSGSHPSQTDKAYIEGIVNQYPEQSKFFDSLAVDCEVQPDSVNFTTKQHISFLTGAEFEVYEESWLSPIKEDSTTSGVNDGNTTMIFGKWLKVRFNFAVNTYQKLSNIIVNFTVSKIIK